MNAVGRWLVQDWQWPAATMFAALFLCLIAPVFQATAGLALTSVFLQLPVYMFHQGEEHLGDRFRLYINRTIGRGQEALTPWATFWINALGVWAVDLLALYLAWAVDPSAGLAAGYLAVVNAIAHTMPAIRSREYNPGLVTAIVLLLPFGGWCLAVLGPQAGLLAHALSLGAALAVHGLIIFHVARRVAQLPQSREVSA